MRETQTLGRKLYRARLAKDLSLRQLSKETGVSTGAIMRAEADEGTSDRTIFRLAEFYGFDIDECLDALEATA